MKATYSVELKGYWGKVTISSEHDTHELVNFLTLLSIVFEEAADIEAMNNYLQTAREYKEIRQQIRNARDNRYEIQSENLE